MGFLAKVGADIGGSLITGAFGLGGAALQSRAQGQASERQAEANQEALRFQREQAARAEQAYKQRWMQNMAMRNQLLQRYGLSIPEMQNYQQPGPGMPQQPGAVPRGGVPRGGQLTLAELAMRGKPVGLE